MMLTACSLPTVEPAHLYMVAPIDASKYVSDMIFLAFDSAEQTHPNTAIHPMWVDTGKLSVVVVVC